MNEALEEAVSCYPVSILSHRYEHLTEMLADVEVDIFRPWVQNATKKGRTPLVAVQRKRLLDGARPAIKPCSTSSSQSVLVAIPINSISAHPNEIYAVVARSWARREKLQIDVGDPDPWDDVHVVALLGP